MAIADYLSLERVCILDNENKRETILKLISLLEESGKVQDIQTLTEQLFYREELMSTGLGAGLGIPHVRFKGVDSPIVAVGISKKGVEDYDSIDESKVHIVIMIIVGSEQHKMHISIMSKFAKTLQNADLKNKIINSESTEEVYNLLINE